MKLAEDLIKEHCPEYSFKFSNSIRNHGKCFTGKKLITVSMNLLPYGDEFKRTLLHEIAHAMTPGNNHGYEWMKACIKLGINPSRLKTIPGYRKANANYSVKCQDCGAETHYIKRPKWVGRIEDFHCGLCRSKKLTYEVKK